MKILRHIARPTRGVGDWDTSDLPGGHEPTNGAYYRETTAPKKPIVNSANIDVSERIGRMTGAHIESVKMDVNGYHVTVNRYDGNDDRLQVFIDSPDYGNSIVETVSADQLNQFVYDHTR